ncbi:MAG TPA: ABC transporter substrate-binding protein [Anaeromyxobacteraceae bacterium]|nr:ABC transporter substrate-binding protein [Anaeromyxobacteraceae bacterium]
MALLGELGETSFSDLVQLYVNGHQTVAVRVQSPEGDSGDFYLKDGDLVHARFGTLAGRDAIRAALRLKAGGFRVEPNVLPPARNVHQNWMNLLLEEALKLDEERRGGRTPVPAAQADDAPPRLARVPTKPVAAVPLSTKKPGPGRKALVAVGTLFVALAAGAVFSLHRAESGRSEPAAPSAAPSAAAAPVPAEAGELLLGMVGPFSGSNREIGRGMKAGLELALALANEGGGVLGKKLRLVAVDDGNEPSRAGAAMRELLEERKVFAVVGNVGSAEAKSTLPLALEKKVLFFGALSGDDALRRNPPDRYVFNFRPSYAEEAAAATHYLLSVRHYRPEELAFFGQDDAYGEAGWAGLCQQMKKQGRDPSAVLRTRYARNSLDIEDAVTKVGQAGQKLKGVVMFATYPVAARFIERTKGLGASLVYTADSEVDSSALAEALVQAKVPVGGDLLVTQVVPLPTSQASAVIRYRDLLAAHALGQAPGSLSLEGYLAGTLLVEGLKRAGPVPDTEKLVAALEGLGDLDLGVGARLGFSPTEHQASHKIWGTLIEPDGSYRNVDLE